MDELKSLGIDESAMNTKLPSPISSLTEFVNIITCIQTGNLNDGEEFERLIAEGRKSADAILAYIGSDDVSIRTRTYNDCLESQTGYARFSDPKDIECFFYRGQDDIEYGLVPSIFRDNLLKDGDYFYHEIQVRCPDYFRNTSHLDKLVIMQHYGIPTRLLDITSNPLVALYFACQKSKREHDADKEPNGRVYLFGLRQNDMLYSDSDKVLMLSSIAKFSQVQKSKMLDDVYKCLNNGKTFQIQNERYSSDLIEKFYHEVTTEQPSFKRRIRPLDLVRPVFVKPYKSNDRILKQDGAFIISGLNDTEKEVENKLNQYVYLHIEIDGESKNKILSELDDMGISEASLFPDIEHIGHYLKELKGTSPSVKKDFRSR